MSEEKYGITDAHYLCDSAIFNTETNEIFRLYQICEMLNEQDKQISSLETKLALYEQSNKVLNNQLNKSTEHISELNEQLAEREDKIKKAYREGLLQKQFDKDAEIMLLKQQLAEKEKGLVLAMSKLNIKEHQPAYCKLADRDCECMGKVEELKQQLAEKEKEIETMKKNSDKNVDYLVEFASLIENEKDCNRMLKALDRVKSGNKYIIDKTDQAKTEFAIQQLQRVKEWCEDNYDTFDDKIVGGTGKVIGLDKVLFIADMPLYDFIDQIIKELEGK